MGFWIFMLAADLLVPLALIVFGFSFVKKAPREINHFYGYRTSMSMKNRDTWEFAHRYLGRLWSVAGIALLPVTVVLMALVFGRNEDLVGGVGTAITLFEVVVLLATIIPTEAALVRNFDRQGRRRVPRDRNK